MKAALSRLAIQGLLLLSAMVVTGACAAPTIVPPDASVPKELAVFSGTWVGKWGGITDTTLVVLNIEPPFATVLYEWGRYSGRGEIAGMDTRVLPGSVIQKGKFEDGKLILKFTNGAVAVFRMDINGTLGGTYEPRGASGETSRVTLVRRAVAVSIGDPRLAKLAGIYEGSPTPDASGSVERGAPVLVIESGNKGKYGKTASDTSEVDLIAKSDGEKLFLTFKTAEGAEVVLRVVGDTLVGTFSRGGVVAKVLELTRKRE